MIFLVTVKLQNAAAVLGMKFKLKNLYMQSKHCRMGRKRFIIKKFSSKEFCKESVLQESQNFSKNFIENPIEGHTKYQRNYHQ